ncbi:LysM peptidoglycan-binding domain-containing protein [Elusimicrobiota bacterium]
MRKKLPLITKINIDLIILLVITLVILTIAIEDFPGNLVKIFKRNAIHVTIEGDTLESIAEQYNKSLLEIVVHNQIMELVEIRPGRRIKIPNEVAEGTIAQYLAKLEDSINQKNITLMSDEHKLGKMKEELVDMKKVLDEMSIEMKYPNSGRVSKEYSERFQSKIATYNVFLEDYESMYLKYQNEVETVNFKITLLNKYVINLNQQLSARSENEKNEVKESETAGDKVQREGNRQVYGSSKKEVKNVPSIDKEIKTESVKPAKLNKDLSSQQLKKDILQLKEYLAELRKNGLKISNSLDDLWIEIKYPSSGFVSKYNIAQLDSKIKSYESLKSEFQKTYSAYEEKNSQYNTLVKEKSKKNKALDIKFPNNNVNDKKVDYIKKLSAMLLEYDGKISNTEKEISDTYSSIKKLEQEMTLIYDKLQKPEYQSEHDDLKSKYESKYSEHEKMAGQYRNLKEYLANSNTERSKLQEKYKKLIN